SDDPQAPPKPPLGKAADWVQTICPICGGPATRELNTMPQWAGSCWYFLRYLDPNNGREFCDRHAERYWLAPTADNPHPMHRPCNRICNGNNSRLLSRLMQTIPGVRLPGAGITQQHPTATGSSLFGLTA
ncbi:MAG: hypothetical protein WCI75_10830, partial [candidate division NC10 bacterium]